MTAVTRFWPLLCGTHRYEKTLSTRGTGAGVIIEAPILAYLVAPKEPWTFYLFAAVLGATWLATVPPTAGLTAKLFGTRYLATLFGLTLLSHQTGGFFGAWLGGLALAHTGDYQWMWYADAALAAAAALVNLPIREARMRESHA